MQNVEYPARAVLRYDGARMEKGTADGLCQVCEGPLDVLTTQIVGNNGGWRKRNADS